MRAAEMKERPNFPLMRQTDVQSIYHMQMLCHLPPEGAGEGASYLREAGDGGVPDPGEAGSDLGEALRPG